MERKQGYLLIYNSPRGVRKIYISPTGDKREMKAFREKILDSKGTLVQELLHPSYEVVQEERERVNNINLFPKIIRERIK